MMFEAEKVEVGVQQDLESWKKWKLGLSTIVEVEKSKSWRSTKTWKLKKVKLEKVEVGV